MPSIERLAIALTGSEVQFACVTSEPIETVTRVVTSRRLRLPVYSSGGTIPDLFDASSLPATFVIDRDGDVCFKQLGAASWDSEDMVAFLKQLAS